MEIDDSFYKLLHQVQTLVKNYIRDCADKSSWIHWYVPRLGIKPVSISFDEPSKEKFLRKVEFIYDLMIMSHFVVKVVNSKAFNQSGLNSLLTEKRSVIKELSSLSSDDWALFRDQLIGSQFGSN